MLICTLVEQLVGNIFDISCCGYKIFMTVINSQISGSSYGTRKDTKFTFTGPVDLQAGTNRIELLSIAVGLPVSFSSLLTVLITRGKNGCNFYYSMLLHQ